LIARLDLAIEVTALRVGQKEFLEDILIHVQVDVELSADELHV
jgi:hypothetical protein